MVIQDFINAKKEGKYVLIEDIIDGSYFVNPTKRLMNTYILYTSVDDNGEPTPDIIKTKKIITKEDKDRISVSFDGEDKYVSFYKDSQIVVLRKVENITDDIFKIMNEKYGKKTMDSVSISNIYTCHVVDLEYITPKIVAGRYPYVEQHTSFVNGSYITEVDVLLNNNTVFPRVIYTDVDPTYIRPVLSAANFVTKYMDSENMRYIINGEYLRTNGMVLKLVDIENAIFTFKNILNGEDIYLNSMNAGELVIGSRVISNKYICVEMNKDNEYLFYYYFADEEHKKEYLKNKDKLLEIYENILKEHRLNDSPLLIAYQDVEASFKSIKEIEDIDIEEIETEDEEES